MFEIFTAQCFARSEGDAVNQEIEPAKLFTNLSKGFIDFFLFRDVTREQQRAGHGFACQAFDIFFQAIALVSESEICARFVKGLSSGPGDGALICDSEDDSIFVFEHVCFAAVTRYLCNLWILYS